MKIFLFAILVLLAALSVEATPVKNVPSECDRVCTADYSPVCGGVPGDKSVRPRLFSNKCILRLHNCENKSNLVEVGMDQCQNSGGIRLS